MRQISAPRPRSAARRAVFQGPERGGSAPGERHAELQNIAAGTRHSGQFRHKETCIFGASRDRDADARGNRRKSRDVELAGELVVTADNEPPKPPARCRGIVDDRAKSAHRGAAGWAAVRKSASGGASDAENGVIVTGSNRALPRFGAGTGLMRVGCRSAIRRTVIRDARLRRCRKPPQSLIRVTGEKEGDRGFIWWWFGKKGRMGLFRGVVVVSREEGVCDDPGTDVAVGCGIEWPLILLLLPVVAVVVNCGSRA